MGLLIPPQLLTHSSFLIGLWVTLSIQNSNGRRVPTCRGPLTPADNSTSIAAGYSIAAA